MRDRTTGKHTLCVCVISSVYRHYCAIYTVLSWILKLNGLSTQGKTGKPRGPLAQFTSAASSSLLLRLSLQAARTGAQTITVIMESHVLLRRMRPADWLTAGAPRASCTSNGETGRGESEGGEAARRKRKKRRKKNTIRKQRGEGFTSHPLSSTSLVIFVSTLCPCQGASPSTPPLLLLPRSQCRATLSSLNVHPRGAPQSGTFHDYKRSFCDIG